LSYIYRAALKSQPSMKDLGKRLRKHCPQATDDMLHLLASLWEKEGMGSRPEMPVKVNELVDIQWRLSVPLAGSPSQTVFLNKPLVTLSLTTRDRSAGGALKVTTMDLSYASFLELTQSMSDLNTAMQALESRQGNPSSPAS